VGQRSTLHDLGLPREVEPMVVRDALEDAAIANSPRLPSADEIAGILAAVRG
jgi:alcohol dehydrogenase class IV